MNHADLLPGEENIQTYNKEAQELFVHVKTQAKDPELITQALKYEAYTSLTLNEFDQVLEILGDQVPVLFPIESLIAAAQQQKGEEQQAVITLQSAIYQYTTVFLSFLGNYLQVVINQPEKFAETVSRGIQFTDIFHFKRMHPVALMNFQLSAIFGYAQMQNETAAFPLLNDFLEVMRETDFPVELHGDDYFDQVDKWLEQLEIGHQLPRDSMKIKETLINFVINNPAFANFSDQAQLQQIYTELRLLQKGAGRA